MPGTPIGMSDASAYLFRTEANGTYSFDHGIERAASLRLYYSPETLSLDHHEGIRAWKRSPARMVACF